MMLINYIFYMLHLTKIYHFINSNHINIQPMQSVIPDISKIYAHKTVADCIQQQILEIDPSKVQIRHNYIFITIMFDVSTQHYHFFINNTPKIMFYIVLGKGYPLYPPKLFLKSAITSPAINDCRDILSEVVQNWSIKTKLKQILNQIPKFLNRLQNITEQIRLQKIGRFQLNTKYDLLFLKQLGGEEFLSFQVIDDNIKLYVISQTDTHFLLFVPKQQPYFLDQKLQVPKQNQITTMTLIFTAEVQSIKEIYISKQNNLQYIFTFGSVKTRNLQLEPVQITKRLKIANGYQLLAKMIRSSRKYQPIKINVDTNPQKNSEQQNILLLISKIQEKITKYLNKQTIEQMNKAYQDAVEYYSGKGLPYYEIYLAKISDMYTRSDVKLILGVK